MSAAASPAPSDRDTQDREISYRFCQDCANLLYPKEDRATNELFFVCKACHRIERHNVQCTYRHVLNQTAGETAGVTTDVASDPTLPRASRQCPKCAETEAVFFQSQQRASDTGMKLYYVCVYCGHVYT